MTNTIDAVVMDSEIKALKPLTARKFKAEIRGPNNKVLFSQEVTAPECWSERAIGIVAQKYLLENESSISQMAKRVAGTIAQHGISLGYFSNEATARVFCDSLQNITLQQLAAFNSPVWFNVGREMKQNAGESYTIDGVEDTGAHPQASACFIQGIEDSIKSIMRVAEREAVIFKHGGGSGVNVSAIRSAKEKLSGGGEPSGPLSFMRIHDSVASVVKSGGRTRRAAQMRIMNDDHPDIFDFVHAKAETDRHIRLLMNAGMSGGMNGDAATFAGLQNSNLSVRITDELMEAAEHDKDWTLTGVHNKDLKVTVKANQLLDEIAKASWESGDPGIQFGTTINKWNTCKDKFTITASNPCGEFLWVNNSACNLASINLLEVTKLSKQDPQLLVKVVNNIVIAQNILMDFSSFPSKEIADNTRAYRPIGLGITNLGGLLMETGVPYDSDEARVQAAALMSTISAHAYQCSSKIGEQFGPYPALDSDNSITVLQEVLMMHKAAAPKGTKLLWDPAIKGAPHIRNAQVTVIAPTGTISFLMDCATTGVEPETSLRMKTKDLCDGGVLKMESTCFVNGLRFLGYTHDQIMSAATHIGGGGPLGLCQHIKEEHKPVFFCSLPVVDGDHYLKPEAHIKMMAAIQPLVSGAISKTIQMPHNASISDVRQVILDSWKMGLKSITIYRDGSKPHQPLNVGNQRKTDPGAGFGSRKRLPMTRDSITHRYEIGGHEGYVTVGKYPDGSPGEMFGVISKEGSTVAGLMNAFTTAISLCLQCGVKPSDLCNKFKHMRFEPSGFTGNPDIPQCTSIVDYLFQFLERELGDGNKPSTKSQPSHTVCTQCGNIMQVAGACSVCPNCGESSGSCG